MNVSNSSTVTPSTIQSSLERVVEITQRPMTLQDCNTSPGVSNQSINDGAMPEIPESPVTAFARYIDSLPLSSLLVTSPILTTSPSSSSSNSVASTRTAGTPSKRKCATNLSQRFNEDT